MKRKLSIVIVLILTVGIWISRNYKFNKNNDDTSTNQSTSETFDRSNDHLILTKHAKCRMACRDITSEEIEEILHKGNINYTKSELNDSRGPKYALEGYSHEHQHLRIIFAPEQNGMVVVTCIDLEKDWSCDCN